ncbi:hypothetical protein N7467_008124 [Penicillium canescens]|nr:hypothetical protein N7467_008124 [Penicillium canescens]
MAWLSQIFAVSNNDEHGEPGNHIATVDRNSADINKGFGGKFVWIIATFNSNQDRAISTVQIQIQDKQDENRWDLSAGAGGNYRYLHPLKEGTAKITEIKLLRRSEKVEWATVKDLGFQGWSGDINQGRGGDFLHLVWKY